MEHPTQVVHTPSTRCPFCGAPADKERPCPVCGFNAATEQIPSAAELREEWLPHYQEMRSSFNTLHRELQSFADRRLHHCRSLQLSRIICLLLGVAGVILLINALVRTPTLESVLRPLVIIFFAIVLDFLVRRSNIHTAKRQLEAISLLQTQIESNDPKGRAPLAFALCHPAVLRRIATAADPAAAVGRIRRQAEERAAQDAGRWPLREVEKDAMTELALWNLCTEREKKSEG